MCLILAFKGFLSIDSCGTIYIFSRKSVGLSYLTQNLSLSKAWALTRYFFAENKGKFQTWLMRLGNGILIFSRDFAVSRTLLISFMFQLMMLNSTDSSFSADLESLDSIPTRNHDTVFIFYVKSGQTDMKEVRPKYSTFSWASVSTCCCNIPCAAIIL